MTQDSRTLIVIKDGADKVIGAQVLEPQAEGVQAFISPAHEDHTLHKLSDVPADVHGLDHPEEFFRALTRHIASPAVKSERTSPEALRATLFDSAG